MPESEAIAGMYQVCNKYQLQRALPGLQRFGPTKTKITELSDFLAKDQVAEDLVPWPSLVGMMRSGEFSPRSI